MILISKSFSRTDPERKSRDLKDLKPEILDFFTFIFLLFIFIFCLNLIWTTWSNY